MVVLHGAVALNVLRRIEDASRGRLGAKLGRIMFFKTRPEAPALDELTGNRVGRRERRGPAEGKDGEIPSRVGR